ncbi:MULTISPECIES: RcnB family protein [Sphingomonas]|uniref:RcnB family protein n=2 Tax=Sphingomonas TaxID=13687 RepID=A0AA42CSE5_9SPHN|nr:MULTISPECIES: RcnB family protein [Sphingomonas]MCW6528858.1 RcnB family protein [Sphingomonas lycopersici]MCW6537680.1 RcnB family protein [Sphingomonas lycopersici]
MRLLSRTLAGLTAMASILSTVPATAQGRWDDHDRGRRDDDGRRDWRDQRHDNGRRGWRDDRDGRSQYRWHNYGGRYGYNGYRGRWRTGQRFTYWNDNRYYVNDWRRYNLPPPRPGYRYYRDDNGDIVMAAIASGVIGLILGSQMGNRW